MSKRRPERVAPNRHTVRLKADLTREREDLAVATYLRRARQRAAAKTLLTPARRVRRP